MSNTARGYSLPGPVVTVMHNAHDGTGVDLGLPGSKATIISLHDYTRTSPYEGKLLYMAVVCCLSCLLLGVKRCLLMVIFK